MEQTFIAGALWGGTISMLFSTIMAWRKIRGLKQMNRDLQKTIRDQSSENAYLKDPSGSCVWGPQITDYAASKTIEPENSASKAANPCHTNISSNSTIEVNSCAGEPVETGYQETPRIERPFLGLW